jgi:hypothetical protein
MATNRIAYPLTVLNSTPGHGFYRSEKVIGGTVALTSADVGTINDTVQLFRVPAGFTVTGVSVEVPTSLAASALTLSLGDATTPARFISASTIGVAGGKVDVLAAGALGFKYTVETDIQLLVAAAGVTPAAGTIVAFLKGFIDA